MARPNITDHHILYWFLSISSTVILCFSDSALEDDSEYICLICFTYGDLGHPFIMVIFEDPWHSQLLPSVWQWSCHYLFLRLKSVAAGIRTPNLPLTRRTVYSTAPPPWSINGCPVSQSAQWHAKEPLLSNGLDCRV